jgi:hypothetical protein
LLALSVAWRDEVTMRGTSRISAMSGSARLRHSRAPNPLRDKAWSGLPGTQVVEFSPSDEYAQTMAVVAKNLQGMGS